MIKKVLDQIENEQLKKEVEKDLFNLEFALFKEDNVNLARVKQLLECLKNMKIPLF